MTLQEKVKRILDDICQIMKDAHFIVICDNMFCGFVSRTVAFTRSS